MNRIALIALLALIPTPALADPVSIGAAIAGVASWWASIGVVAQAAIGIGVALAATGISYVLSGGRRLQQASNDRLQSVNVPERDGLLERVRIYGTDTTPGGVFFQKTLSNGSTGNPSIYVFGAALSEGECDSLDSVIINGVRCRIDALGQPIDAPWFDGSTAYFKVSFRGGTDTQAIDPIILARFPTPPADFLPGDPARLTKWPQFRQRGICTVVIEMQFGATADQHTLLWGAGGIPQLLFRVKGLKIYDPRDPAQNTANRTTWKWSDNATLVETDWLMCDMGFDIPFSQIDLTGAVVASANLDDAAIPTLAGSEKNGRINGRAYSSEANADVLDSMTQQNRALVRRADGVYTVSSQMKAMDPVMTIHQDMLIGDISYQNEPDTRAILNQVSVQFQPASRYNQSAEIAYTDTARIVTDGQLYDRRVSLKFNDSPAAAQRLGYALVEENRAARTLAMAVDIAAYVAPGKTSKHIEKGDIVQVYFRDYTAINGLYMVDDFQMTTNFAIQFSLVGYNPSMISGWSTALEKPFSQVA